MKLVMPDPKLFAQYLIVKGQRQSQKWLCLFCYWIPNGEVNENVLGRGKDCGVHLTKPQNTITMRFDRYRVEIIKPGGYTKIKSKLFG